MHKKRVLLYTFNKIVNLLASEKRDPEVRGLSVIKIRKKVARDKLWEAQNGNSFICTAEGAFVNSSFRQNSYKNLVEAEKIVRECNEFEESVSCFDYNGDGLNEYIIRMQNYFAAVNLLGGAIREFDLMQASGNYADNLSRVRRF